jgi:hypothetical protein
MTVATNKDKDSLLNDDVSEEAMETYRRQTSGGKSSGRF